MIGTGTGVAWRFVILIFEAKGNKRAAIEIEILSLENWENHFVLCNLEYFKITLIFFHNIQRKTTGFKTFRFYRGHVSGKEMCPEAWCQQLTSPSGAKVVAAATSGQDQDRSKLLKTTPVFFWSFCLFPT